MAVEAGQSSEGTVRTELRENAVGLPGMLMQGIATIAPSFAILASFVFIVSSVKGMGWISRHPMTTFVLTLVDVKNAMNVTPGRFAARGHDYRADLARMVSETFRLAVTDDELLAIEHALRRREAEWARRRLVAEQLHRAKEAVQRQTKTWGLTGDTAEVGAGSA